MVVLFGKVDLWASVGLLLGVMAPLIKYFLLLFLLGRVPAQKVIPHEPMSVVKSYLVPPSPGQLDLWSPLLSRGNQRDGLIGEIKKHLKHLLESKSFVLAIDNDPVVELFPPDMKWNTTYKAPITNIMAFISTSLSILLEGYEADILITPLVKLSERTGVQVPQRLHQRTLMELFSKAPEIDITEKLFLAEYTTFCHVAFEIVNGLLGRSFGEAWRDAFMSLQLDNTILDDRRSILVPFQDLYRFTEVVQSDLKTLPTFPPGDLPYDRSPHYTFGWWINCADEGACLIDALPSDAIFSFGPSMGVYIVPSLKMSAVMVATPMASWNTKTFDEILLSEIEIWRQLLMIVSPLYHGKVLKEREEMKQENKEDTSDEVTGFSIIDLPRFIVYDVILYIFYMGSDFTSSQHYLLRVLFWVGFLMIGHFVVYSGFHVVWKLFTILFPRTHRPRPKTAKQE